MKGIRCTNLARTLLDLASLVDVGALEQAVDGALRYRPSVRSWTLKLLGTLGDHGLTGAASLRTLLNERVRGTQDSALEVRVRRLIKNGKLPMPATNVAITDDQARHIATVDFAWPQQRVALQAHGYRAHASHQAFEKDHRQSSRLTAFGWRVLEVTAERLRDEPLAVLQELRKTINWPPITPGSREQS